MMKSHRRVLFFVTALAVVGLVVLVTLHAQKQKPAVAQEQYDLRHTPTTDYDKAEPADPERRRLRKIRADRFKIKGDEKENKRFTLTERRQSGYGSFPIHAKPEPALPAAQSDAVVIGEVTGAEAFLSVDKISLYSQFTINVSQVLKDISPGTLKFGDAITTIRGGGAVRFPSGKVVWQGFHGKPFPLIGRRYVVFLKYNADGQDFSIFTAYELISGRVFPLDGLDSNGEVVHQLAEHQTFSGMDEATFLAKVREAIYLSPSNDAVGR